MTAPRSSSISALGKAFGEVLDQEGAYRVGVAQLDTMLDDAVDRHYCRPAVECGGFETDFERFDESVGWLTGDLVARGVQPRQRIGLCITSGWEFVLAFHALVRLDTVVVPIDPFDEISLNAAADLGLHFIVSHTPADVLLDEMVQVICGEETGLIFDVAGEFTLTAVSEELPLHPEGGLILYDFGYEFWTSSQVTERVGDLQDNLGLDSATRAMICGPPSCPCAVMLVLACAASGSCVQVVPGGSDVGQVEEAMVGGEVSVVFAPPLLMCDLVRVVEAAGSHSSRPRMVLPDGEVLPEVVLRRRGMERRFLADPPIYEFGERGVVGLLTVS